MTTIEVRRTGKHTFIAHNDRGASVDIGRAGQDGSFSPVELLLAAAAGCVAVTAEQLVVRRVGEEPLRVDATDVRPPGAHELDGVRIDLGLALDGLDDAAREELLTVVDRAVEALCTVTRTLKRATAVELAPPSR